MGARTVDPAILYQHISLSNLLERIPPYFSLFSSALASTALDWAISSRWRTRSLVLLVRSSRADMNPRRSIPKLYTASKDIGSSYVNLTYLGYVTHISIVSTNPPLVAYAIYDLLIIKITERNAKTARHKTDGDGCFTIKRNPKNCCY